MEERGQKNTRRRQQERRRRNAARRRRRRRMRIVVLCILLAVVILLVAGITAAVRAFLKSGDEKDGGKTAAKDITIEDVQEKDSDDDISSGGTQADDARAVKNTATEEHHKTNGLAICMFHYVYDEADPPDDLRFTRWKRRLSIW